MTNLYRELPAVHELLGALGDHAATHTAKLDACRSAIAQARVSIQQTQHTPSFDQILEMAIQFLAERSQLSLRPVINATGVIIHTNLGRAPLSTETLATMQAVAGGYSNLEYDLVAGKRGKRDVHVQALLSELTGAEASVVVNNNAAAVNLVLAAIAKDREIIVSRGQLVEIGGGYRIPDVMRQGGAMLVEVGTTNRTRIADYEAVITSQTVALMRVHSSNFKQIGFVQETSLAEMAEVAHRHNIILIDDLGSGTLIDTTHYGLASEPTVQASVAANADLILFSGDKLLGGPQAGIIIGKAALITTLLKHPLMRALRPDKTTLAGLARTLQHYRDDEALNKVPVWRMITTSFDVLKARTESWQAVVGGDVVEAQSTVGGGSLPGDTLPTWALKLHVDQPDTFASALREQNPPVISRIQDNALWFDPRTVFPEQDQQLLHAIQQVMGE